MVQWQNVTDMLLAQTEPKDKKQRQKEIDNCWVVLCDNYGWDNTQEVKTQLAPKIREMEKKAHSKLRRHVEGKDNVKWYSAGKHGSEENNLRKDLRIWTRVALTATALSPEKTQRGERKKEVSSSKVEERKEIEKGSIQATPSAPPSDKSNPASLYPVLTQPPPYAPPNQHPPQQQVVMQINSGEVDVDMGEITDSVRKLSEEMLGLKKIVSIEMGKALNTLDRSVEKEEECMRPYLRKIETSEEYELDNESMQSEEGQQNKAVKVQINGEMIIEEPKEPVAHRTRTRVEHRDTGREHSENRDSVRLTFEPMNQLMRTTMQAPLLHKPGGNPQYQPWSHSDMTAIASKLPPITSGGSRWLSKLTALCHGTDLALGDLRCLWGQILTASQMRNLELDAKTEIYANETPFTRVSTDIGKALRRLYPVPPTVYQNIKFRIKPGETGAAYYFRCAAEWEQMVEENSLNNPITRDIFRTAVMTGAPNGVKQVMENNPDIPVASNEVWERHLVHHIDRAVDKVTKEEEELEKVKTQLLKLQLEKAKGEGVTKKAKQMPQRHHPRDPYEGPPYSGSPFGGPPTAPNAQHFAPPWGQNFNQRQGTPWRGNRGRQGGSGRGGQSRSVCYVCGQYDHWARDCPQAPQNQGQYNGPPAGGWGPRGGGSGGRGRGPQTPHNPGQHLSPPSNLQAPMHPTWGPEGGAEEC